MRYVPWLVALAGLIVSIAHVFSIMWIIQPATSSSPMAPITSSWFMLAGLMVGAMEFNGHRKVPQIIASTCAFGLLSTLGMVLYRNGVLLTISPAPEILGLPDNMPSLCTMVAFAAMAWWAVARLVDLRFSSVVGATVAGTVGALGVLGFASGNASLTCAVAGVSTGIAIHTAVLLVALSCAAVDQTRRLHAPSA